MYIYWILYSVHALLSADDWMSMNIIMLAAIGIKIYNFRTWTNYSFYFFFSSESNKLLPIMHVTYSCSLEKYDLMHSSHSAPFARFAFASASSWLDSGFLLLSDLFFAYNTFFLSLSIALCIYHFATLIFYWWIFFLPCRGKKYFCCRTFRMNIIFEALCMLRGTDREHMCASTYVYVMQSEIYWNKIERERESGNKRKQSIEMKFRW